MIVRVDHAHLQGHLEDRARVLVVQVQDDIEDVAADGIDQHAAIFVVRELSNENVGLIDAWIVEKLLQTRQCYEEGVWSKRTLVTVALPESVS